MGPGAYRSRRRRIRLCRIHRGDICAPTIPRRSERRVRPAVSYGFGFHPGGTFAPASYLPDLPGSTTVGVPTKTRAYAAN